ncbi:DUF4142 domain-containing protein [Micromonospora sp. DT47]|uniref:DUF4142 domain-containing protein n=1 Tax=Micromonospora sp. DT47 TaxID=3393431 RepID=UPI003CE77053
MSGIKRLGLLAALVLVGIAPAGVAQAAVQPSKQDTQYLKALHQVNLFEIKAGEEAQEESQNQEIKDLGAMFKTDHTQLDETVKQTAKKLNVDLPSKPTADQQSVLDQIEKVEKTGEEFDRLWVTSQLAGHVQAIQATQTEISQGSEQSVVQLAKSALPTLQAHHDALVQLAQQLGIPVPQATASGTPSPGGTTPAPGGTTESPGGGTETPSPGQS